MNWERIDEWSKLMNGGKYSLPPAPPSACRTRGAEREAMAAKKIKRVMVLVDRTARAKNAMVWALTHAANRGDLVTLLHVLPAHCSSSAQREEEIAHLINSLGLICKAIRPQVIVEVLVIQGPKLTTVLGQVKKLDVSVLVVKQSRPSLFCCMFRSRHEDFVEQCINRAECLTMAVKKQGGGVGGYLVSSRWQKNFWLLA
ncbi:hypothetical protein Cni_G20701 [Canna indica]|uniref:UspA domain-containing protein n=1 Tax=Canna indica TaxID=4628 RepID=A0AAQ3KN56_9LILI|nr:hypothetical protein Cni_G20701 [Canna indica]